MNNFDISQYLVEPEFAAWLKEQGFNGECCAHYSETPKNTRFTSNPQTLKNSLTPNDKPCLPTFQQAFDFCEERFDIDVKIYRTLGVVWAHVDKNYRVILSTPNKTKREANIAACNAIKEYISQQAD